MGTVGTGYKKFAKIFEKPPLKGFKCPTVCYSLLVNPIAVSNEILVSDPEKRKSLFKNSKKAAFNS